MMVTKSCKYCMREFIGIKKRKFCKNSCRQAFYRNKLKEIKSIPLQRNKKRTK